MVASPQILKKADFRSTILEHSSPEPQSVSHRSRRGHPASTREGSEAAETSFKDLFLLEWQISSHIEGAKRPKSSLWVGHLELNAEKLVICICKWVDCAMADLHLMARFDQLRMPLDAVRLCTAVSGYLCTSSWFCGKILSIRPWRLLEIPLIYGTFAKCTLQ